MHTAPANSRFVGIALIALGFLFLLPLVTGFEFPLSKWWPLFLLFAGAGSLSKGSRTGGLIVIAMSLVLLLNNLDILKVNVWLLWPVALILTGAGILFGHSRWRTGGAGDAPDAGGDLNMACFFSGANRRIDNQRFDGGRVSVTCGGAEIDLRGAALANVAATINVNALFGGIELYVPADWAVDVRASATFGGIETPRAWPAEPKATLTITGSCLFGGIEIKS